MTGPPSAQARLGATSVLALIGSDGARARWCTEGVWWSLTLEHLGRSARIRFAAAEDWSPDDATDLIGVRPLPDGRLELRLAGLHGVYRVPIADHHLVGPLEPIPH